MVQRISNEQVRWEYRIRLQIRSKREELMEKLQYFEHVAKFHGKVSLE